MGQGIYAYVINKTNIHHINNIIIQAKRFKYLGWIKNHPPLILLWPSALSSFHQFSSQHIIKGTNTLCLFSRG